MCLAVKMPKIDVAKAVVRTTTVYPQPYDRVTVGREKTVLGNVAGLTQFGVNRTLLRPGAASALRHWHEAEDEFIYVLEGETVQAGCRATVGVHQRVALTAVELALADGDVHHDVARGVA